jgi:hypothetical protein
MCYNSKNKSIIKYSQKMPINNIYQIRWEYEDQHFCYFQVKNKEMWDLTYDNVSIFEMISRPNVIKVLGAYLGAYPH